MKVIRRLNDKLYMPFLEVTDEQIQKILDKE